MSTSLKDLIIAYHQKGMSYREIAEKTQTTEEYCRTIWSRFNRQQLPFESDDGLCRYCGQPLVYTAGYKKKQFCSDKCCNDFHNREKKRKLYIRTCEYCKSEFVAYGYPKKRFCSRECHASSARKGSDCRE